MKYLPFCLLAWVSACSGLVTPVRAQADQTQTNLSLLALPPRVQHPPLFLVLKDDETLPLEIASNCLTGPVKATVENRWRFALTAQPTQRGQELQLAASCPTIDSAREQLVVLVKRPGEATSYGAFSVNVDRRTFKERQFLIVNLTPVEIAGEIGGVRMSFPPGKPIFVTPKPNISQDLCHAMFLTRGAGKNWKPFFSTNWPLKDKLRGLVFFYQDPGGRKILLHAVSDFL